MSEKKENKEKKETKKRWKKNSEEMKKEEKLGNQKNKSLIKKQKTKTNGQKEKIKILLNKIINYSTVGAFNCGLVSKLESYLFFTAKGDFYSTQTPNLR